MAVFLTMTGADALDRALLDLAGAVSDDRLGDVVQLGAEVIQEEARRLAPVVTGALRDSIEVHLVAASGPYAEAEIGTNSPYGARIEFGGDAIDSLGRHWRQAAQPYLRPALDSQADIAEARMVSLLQTTLGAD